MATQAVLTYSNGKLDVPAELQRQLHLAEGQLIQLTIDERRATFTVDPSSPAPSPHVKSESYNNFRNLQGMLARPAVPITLPADLDTNPMALRGFLTHSEFDPNANLAVEKAWELVREEWMHGPFRAR